MPDCDGFFDALGISFTPDQQDAAVRAVKAADFFDPPYKKFLIMCWFDTTYGQWNGSRFDLRDSRDQMSNWLQNNEYATFEEFLDTTGGTNPNG